MLYVKILNGNLRDIAIGRGIYPKRCHTCKTPSFSAVGYDDGSDPNYIGYQCGCGAVVWLTRGTVLRRARAMNGGEQ